MAPLFRSLNTPLQNLIVFLHIKFELNNKFLIPKLMMFLNAIITKKKIVCFLCLQNLFLIPKMIQTLN